MTYGISSRHYLERAISCLSKRSQPDLFYAALELRCGIEARMQEYLEGWEHVTAKKQEGWRIAKLGKTTEKAFMTGAKIQRVEIATDDAPNVILYYTPVSPALRKNGDKLGNYLHALKQPTTNNVEWWDKMRCLLLDTATKLEAANAGTLLGPVLLGPSRRQMHMKVETPRDVDPDVFIAGVGAPGKQIHMNVTYVDILPNPIEPEARLWTQSSSHPKAQSRGAPRGESARS